MRSQGVISARRVQCWTMLLAAASWFTLVSTAMANPFGLTAHKEACESTFDLMGNAVELSRQHRFTGASSCVVAANTAFRITGLQEYSAQSVEYTLTVHVASSEIPLEVIALTSSGARQMLRVGENMTLGVDGERWSRVQYRIPTLTGMTAVTGFEMRGASPVVFDDLSLQISPTFSGSAIRALATSSNRLHIPRPSGRTIPVIRVDLPLEIRLRAGQEVLLYLDAGSETAPVQLQCQRVFVSRQVAHPSELVPPSYTVDCPQADVNVSSAKLPLATIRNADASHELPVTIFLELAMTAAPQRTARSQVLNLAYPLRYVGD